MGEEDVVLVNRAMLEKWADEMEELRRKLRRSEAYSSRTLP